MSVDQSFPMGLGTPISSLGSDFSANGKLYPGYVAQPLPNETAGLYSAWREINGAQWMLQNADIGPTGFYLVNPASPGWAFVLLPGGGYEMNTAPANSSPGFTWTVKWLVDNTGTLRIGTGGVGAPLVYNSDLSPLGIYNYGNFGGISSATAAANSTAMTNMLAAMQTLNGGLGGGAAFINSGSYNINCGPYYIPTQTTMSAVGLAIGQGNSGNIQGTFYVQNNGTLFKTNPQSIGFGGTTISNVSVSFAGMAGQSAGNVAFDCSHSSNVRFYQCMFQNCPTAVMTDNRSNNVGLTNCTINYTNGPNNGTGGWVTPGTGLGTGTGFAALVFTSVNCYVSGPGELAQKPLSTGGPTGCICIAITQSSEHTSIQNSHLSDWDVGISYAVATGSGNGVKYSHVGNLEMNVWTCGVFMVPWSSTGTIFGEKYSNCSIFQSQSSTVTNNSLIYIDPLTIGGSNNNIEDIEFSDCTVFSSAGGGNGLYALNIHGGNNIRVTGGCYSNMSPTGGAGIAITGACGYVQITNVNLNPRLANAANPQNQQYALLVSGSPVQPIIVDNCMMNNYSGPPVSVTGTPSELRITNCPGYNDQNTVISTVAPSTALLSTGAQTAATLGGGAINYYGPSMVTGVGNAAGSTLHISGTAYALPASQFFCFPLPNPSDQWWISAAPINFTWLGK
jgi:hypothetical protein